jgi:hypothetical protein
MVEGAGELVLIAGLLLLSKVISGMDKKTKDVKQKGG